MFDSSSLASTAQAASALAYGLDWSLIPETLVALLIFVLRTLDLSLSTLRVLTVIRGQKAAAWLLAVCQSLFYLLGITGVIANLDQPLNIVAYAAGFGSGTVLGASIENRIAPGHSLLRITSLRRGPMIMDRLHEDGIGATELPGSGKDGTVSVIYCYLPRRRIQYVHNLVLEMDPEAFLAVEKVPVLRGGWRA